MDGWMDGFYCAKEDKMSLQELTTSTTEGSVKG